jgi:hypothetical protein
MFRAAQRLCDSAHLWIAGTTKSPPQLDHTGVLSCWEVIDLCAHAKLGVGRNVFKHVGYFNETNEETGNNGANRNDWVLYSGSEFAQNDWLDSRGIALTGGEKRRPRRLRKFPNTHTQKCVAHH